MVKKKTKTKRGQGFSENELDCLLDTLDKHKPISKEEWDLVESEHGSMYPEQGRTADSIRRKFSSLYRKKMPTGDPNCPLPVRRAKRIHIAINQKAELSDGHDSDSFDLSDGDDPELAAVLQDIPLPPLPGAPFEPGATASSGGGRNISNVSATSPLVRDRFHPFPSVSRRQKSQQRASPPGDSFAEFMQFSMMQRELDRQERDRDRAEERERRNEENRMMQQMMMYAIAGSAAANTKNNDGKKDEDE